MSNDKVITGNEMTREEFEALKAELDHLKTVERNVISEKIRIARGFGDLSENSEYDEAKTEQGKLYSKIAEIKDLIEHAEIMEKSEETGKVGIGSKVTVRDEATGYEEVYQIVGSQEANPMQGKLSEESPIGRGLIGHKEGETVIVKAPAGEMQFKILAVKHD